MNKFLKTAITATFAAAAFVGAAAAQDFNHTSQTQSVLVLNDFQAQTNLVLASTIDAKINNMVTAAATDMAALPALNSAEINTQAVASTEKSQRRFEHCHGQPNRRVDRQWSKATKLRIRI